MSHMNPSKENEVAMTPVEAMSDDQLLESLREAFQFLEGVPAIGAEVLGRVVDSLSEMVPDVSEAVSDLLGDSEGDGVGAGDQGPTEA
jgi:hypothetical protein